MATRSAFAHARPEHAIKAVRQGRHASLHGHGTPLVPAAAATGARHNPHARPVRRHAPDATTASARRRADARPGTSNASPATPASSPKHRLVVEVPEAPPKTRAIPLPQTQPPILGAALAPSRSA
ncbi:hypothetical protein CY652_18285 [Burkholderia sp. WAC0059]|uniref:hypothetical protein n=1 Tax=Burkholderia sp. WAC0059 TaxID=2066022 RepID=UPI000C7EF637|nr:hypothetical protein [Burkholderia sp. WAC0059]PLZ00994.1 hypothetical protein CY652_18285 [Burkholderia sp. WAC0059]